MSFETVVDQQLGSEQSLTKGQRQTAAARAALHDRGRDARSAITNGKKLLPWNGRSAQARRLKDLIHAFAEPFGGFERLAEP